MASFCGAFLTLYQVIQEDLKQIPFPRPRYVTYAIAALVTGLSIAFILNVFQPFGTDRFKHDYKIWILSGYGIVAALSICLYYFLSLNLFNARQEDRWTIVHETFDLFGSMLIGLLMCYFYFLVVFGFKLSGSGMFSFLIRAGSVSILPVLGLYGFLFSQFRDLERSTIEFDQPEKVPSKPLSRPLHKSITLYGTNKEDVVSTKEEEVIYIKAEDNYVILHLLTKEGIVSRHMIRSTMKLMFDQLSADIFISCHRSYIINIKKIISLTGNKNNTKVSLEHIKKPIPVSRGKVDEVRSLYSAS